MAYMNTRKILLAASAILLTACSSNDASTATDNAAEINLYSEVSTQTRAANVAVDLQDTQFAEGTEVMVMVTDNAETGTTIEYGLQAYTADGLGGLTTALKQYYPPSGSTVRVCAWHPADAAEMFETATDQRSTADYRRSDLMWATLPAIDKNTPEEGRVLQFKHLFSKILVRLYPGNGVTEEELAGATVTLGTDDLVTSGTFVADEGLFTAAASGTGTLLIATDAGVAVHAAVVVPQNMAGKKISVAVSGGLKGFAIPEGTVFEPGKRYTYSITVNKAELMVTSAIEDWDDPEGWVDPDGHIKV